MGVQEYQTALSKAKVITNTTDATRVKNVGIRIKNAATNYYKSIGREADLQGYNWEFNLLEDKPILVLDEWAADQDPHFRKYFYEELIPKLKNEGKTIIAVTHDDTYFKHADRIVKFDYGQIIKDIRVKDNAFTNLI